MTDPCNKAYTVWDVRSGVPSGEDPPDRVRPPGGGEPREAWARQTGDFQLPRLYLHLRKITWREVPGSQEDPARPHAGNTQGGQGATAATQAPADPWTGEMAEAGRDWTLRVLRGSDQ